MILLNIKEDYLVFYLEVTLLPLSLKPINCIHYILVEE